MLVCLQDVIEKPKVLIIGGGIANFTDVAATFHGIIDALKEFNSILHMHRISIWVRRGGPNCQVRACVCVCVRVCDRACVRV